MNVFVFGLGYTAAFVARSLAGTGARISATTRAPAKASALSGAGYSMHVFAGDAHDQSVARALMEANAVLVSIPPGPARDPVLEFYGSDLARAGHLSWIGYLSTVGVYGDHAGGWVDESTPPNPYGERSRRRCDAEQQWLAFGASSGRPVHLFRLAGIYGPGRNQLAQLAQGTARRIIKPGHVFNRIHVEDIVQAIEASLARPRAGAIYNIADDEPAPPQDVVAFAAGLCDVVPPPEIPYANADLGEMSRSFFSETKRVRNTLMKQELGVALHYPTYREGLTALRAAGEGP